MTDETTRQGAESADTAGSTSGSTPGEESYWEEPTTSKRGEWLAQLQAMIEQIATQAGPVMREVGAKAAELAAVAGEKAGPVAHRAAELTSDAGVKLAERSRTLAAEIRRDQAARGEGPTTNGTDAASAAGSEAETADEATTTGVG